MELNYRGHTITIERDDDFYSQPEDHPINSYGNCQWERGPSHEVSDPNDLREWLSLWIRGCSFEAGFDTPAEFKRTFLGEEDMNGDFVEPSFPGTWHIFPVRAYSHSGMAFSLDATQYPFNCPWDSAWSGMIAIRSDNRTADFSEGETPEAWARREASKRIEWFNAYFNGEFYGWNVEGPYCDDSCWGYLVANAFRGEKDESIAEMVGEAKARIDAGIAVAAKDALETLQGQLQRRKKVLHGTPIYARKPIALPEILTSIGL